MRATPFALALALALPLAGGCQDRVPDYVHRDAALPHYDAGPPPPPGPDGGPPPDAGPFMPGVEVRCTNLGARCRCSEPLDTNGWRDVMTSWADPVDSPMETQCDGEVGGGSVWLPVDTIGIDLAMGMPSASMVHDVWRAMPTTDPSYIFGDAPAKDGSARLCTRVYVRFSRDYQPGGGACTESHEATFAFPGGDGASRLALVDDGTGFHLHAYAFGGTADQTIAGGGTTLAPSDCTGGWCRIEMCLAGDLSGGTGLTASAWVTVLGGGEESFGPAGIGDASDSPLEKVLIADMTRVGTCNGSRSYSHAMQAEWGMDNGQRIGAAAEIEGL